MINRPRVRLYLAILMVLLGGCSWFSTSPSLPEGYLMPFEQPPSTVISELVFLVADNQLHNVYGEPVQLLRSELADKIVPTAIRPVQLDFYGQDFLKWVVESRGKRYRIVHIGDACDFSCTGEFERFLEIMREAKKGWVMLPGNHDGFFFGNEHRDPANDDWRAACKNAGGPLTKDLFVRLYLAALILQQGPGYRALARSLGLDQLGHADLERILSSIPDKGDWRYDDKPGGDHPFLHAVSWNIDGEHPWRSFVVQEVDTTLKNSHPPDTVPGGEISVRAILLDTAQYDRAPRLVPFPPYTFNAGVTGELLPDQIDIVLTWLNLHPDRLWTLIGHHPFDSLTQRTQEALDSLRRGFRIRLYVSAHTHAGQFMVHGKEEDKWLELNVGSILDWSLEIRTLQFFRVGERLMLRSPRYTMHELLRDLEGVPQNEGEWEAKPHEDDYYLRHEDLKHLDAYKTELRLKNTLLAAHHRLLRFNPTQPGASPTAPFWPPGCKSDEEVLEKIRTTIEHQRLDEKIEFLVALDRFERERPVEDPEKRSKFRLSQAIWASKYDFVHARKPLTDDWFIIFPEE
jgi:hypothetical protein